METGKLKLALSAGALALSMALAGCGGSSSSGGATPSGGGDTPTPSTVTLPNGVTAASLVAGRFSIDAGEDVVIGSALFSCEDDDCVVRISDDGEVTKTGGKVEVEPAPTDGDGMLVLDEDTHCGPGTKLNDARSQCVADTSMADAKANLADAMALHKALTYVSTGDIDTAGNLDITGVSGSPSGLLNLKKQEKMAATAMAKLGNWNGADYKGMTGSGNTQITAEARVYSNQAAATNVAFTSRSAGHRLVLATGDGITGDVYTVPDEPQSKAVLDSLRTAGLKTLTDAEKASGLKGSFAGASGTYKCTADTCTAAPVTAGGVDFSADWTFTPDAGAMVAVEDDDYLHFGWWVRKDRDGATHASAFYGVEGDPHEDGSAGGQSDGLALTGNATYNGAAVGKFAIRHGDTANAGHFTADAKIIAKFGTWTSASDGPGLSGTVDNFRLNDGSTDPGWSVSLKRAGWDANDDRYELNSTGTPDTTNGLTTDGTAVEWKIGTSDPAPGQTGQWEAQLFDEKADDGTNAPTTVVGKFEAGFGDTHKMVGAFGATTE